MFTQIQRKFLPTFFEESLFFITVILVTLFFVNQDVRSFFSDEPEKMPMIIVSLLAFCSISIYSVFSKRCLPKPLRYFLVVFATMIIMLLSLFAGLEILDRAVSQNSFGSFFSYVILFFPACNFARAILLMIIFSFSKQYQFENHLANEQGNMFLALIGGTLAVILVLLGNYVLHFSWTINFSFAYFLLEPLLSWYYKHMSS